MLASMLTPNYKFTVESQLRNRVQLPKEGFGPFCRTVWRQFMDVNTTITEAEVVQILLKNTHPNLVPFMKYTGQIQSVNELIKIGKEAEVSLMDADRYRFMAQTIMPPPQPTPGGGPWGRGRPPNRGCFTCGSLEHYAANCPDRNGQRSRSQTPQNKCTRCGGRNHTAAQCRARVQRPRSQQPALN
jgi:hypothetical protein